MVLERAEERAPDILPRLSIELQRPCPAGRSWWLSQRAGADALASRRVPGVVPYRRWWHLKRGPEGPPARCGTRILDGFLRKK